jgi:hypothetical protein
MCFWRSHHRTTDWLHCCCLPELQSAEICRSGDPLSTLAADLISVSKELRARPGDPPACHEENAHLCYLRRPKHSSRHPSEDPGIPRPLQSLHRQLATVGSAIVSRGGQPGTPGAALTYGYASP